MPRTRKQLTTATGRPVFRGHFILTPEIDRKLEQIVAERQAASRTEVVRQLIFEEHRRLALPAEPAEREGADPTTQIGPSA